MPTDTKDAFDAAHTGTLIISSKDLFFLLCGISTPRIEYTMFVTILAPELLAAAGIVAILDNI